MNKPLILIIDDEEAILKTLKEALTDEMYHVETLSQGQKALELIGKIIPDLILLDIFMPNCNGLNLLSQIKKEYPHQKVMIISGFGNIQIAIEAIKKGAIDFFEKPLNLDEILNKISFLKEKTEPISKNETDKKSLNECGISGESNLFMELISQSEKLAPHSFPILITGEHGVGKSILARYIHKKSNLSNEVFEEINCEEEPEEKIKKEFSGDKPKTVYLKHVDKLSESDQKTLLQEIEKNKLIRIIASSRSSLFKMMHNKKFNESLFYNLNKAPLEIPPLRKRPYDIPLLVNTYLEKYNIEYKKRIVLSTQSIRILKNYKWPGNVEELKNKVKKIIICSHDTHKVITSQDLATIIGERKVDFVDKHLIMNFGSIEEATTEFKRKFILYLLQKNNYNIDEVSGRLSITPVQLKNKLLELNISYE